MKIIDGKLLSSQIKNEAKSKVAELNGKGISVCLAVIIVGDDPASKIYVNNKKRACELCGIKSLEFALPKEASQKDVLDLIRTLNNDAGVNGILCQLPLPSHIDEKTVTDSIIPQKDVDGFHPENVGRMFKGSSALLPCTPAGIIEMLVRSGIEISGKHCVVLGRSNIVGKPVAALMLQNNATVTVCHSKTENLKELAASADILISAIGKQNFVTADMVKPGAVVIDVGINRNESGKVCGDVDFENVSKIAQYITPVPGGVGPMTIAMLMQNTVLAAISQTKECCK